MEQTSLETLNKNLLNLTSIVESLKEEFEDRFLTAEEEIKLEESLKDFKEKKTFSIKDIEKERNGN